MDAAEPPRKKNKLLIEPTLNPSLPDDLIVSILARVSRLYYPTLSLVSKHFRSLLTSSELYQTRSQLGRTDNCLYVCLRDFPTGRIPYWLMLCPRPNRSDNKKKKKNKSSGYVLTTIPLLHSPPARGSGVVAVGSHIYNIGGCINGSPSSRVSILDCWSHTWLEAPSMQVERDCPSANFIDGKIYVTGGCYKKRYHRSKWMEVLDIKNKTWKHVSSHARRCHDKSNNVVIDGKLKIIWRKGLASSYNPEDGSWKFLEPEMDLCGQYCEIENVLYFYYYDVGFKWYDTKGRSWRSLNGMKKLPKFARHANVRLADYGGKMALFWDKSVASGGGGGYKKRMIWCAVVTLEKRNSEEIWGTVEWFDAVLPNPISWEYVVEHVVGVNV